MGNTNNMIIELRGRISSQGDLFTGEVIVNGKESEHNLDKYFVEEVIEKIIESVAICDGGGFLDVLKKNALTIKFVDDLQTSKRAKKILQTC